MASRGGKRSAKRRSGLRSQEKLEEGDPQATSDQGETSESVPPNSSSSSSEGEGRPKPKSVSSGAADGELMNLLRDILKAQQQREEGVLEELRHLRMSLQPQPDAPSTSQQVGGVTPSPVSTSSVRRLLPTPATQRSRRSVQDSPQSSDNEYRGSDRRFHTDPKILPFQAGEDIENYLLRFERIAKTWRWPEVEWACRLIPLLSGKALEAYTAMDEEKADSYTDLKAALLEKFDISPETHRQQFRAVSLPAGETPTETYHRLKGLYRRWIRPEQHSKEEIGEKIILEQLLRVFPPDVRTWVKEHEPTDGLTAAKLALQYLNARKGSLPPRGTSSAPRSGQPASLVRLTRGGSQPERPGTTVSSRDQQDSGKTFTCYYCQQPGHKASVCPLRKTKVTGSCYAPRDEDEHLKKELQQKTHKTVAVNGQKVTALLDTGSFTSLVKKSVVPISSVDFNNKTDILCVHGDKHTYPNAELTVVIDDQPYLITVGVVDHLPVDILLGRDFPMLMGLLQSEEYIHETDVSAPVITRSKAKMGVQPLPDLDSSLCQNATQKFKKTKSQRRFEKHSNITGSDTDDLLINKIWEVPANIGELQKNDETLKNLFAKVTDETNAFQRGKEYFIVDNNMLYVLCDGKRRIVIPKNCRPLIMHLAHTIPWAGHLGRHKTYMRVSSRFYWPSMYSDVQQFCATCPICQKTAISRKSDRALLQPLPIIPTPFRRLAMDIVGPLVKSSQGHQYILVVCDYATRFPEAFPLRNITTSSVMQCLVQLFSRTGIPDEILTDQGTNFTSRLMQLFHKQLGITSIKTTPYHPQTDGLVERFNQTLKRMLQKFVDDTGRDWHRWLPFLLFAYREVPQASTGFSPFELLYGWDVQGPLDLLQKSWEDSAIKTKEEGRSVVQYILEMRERLQNYRNEAELHLQKAQKMQKTWYDQHARHREYQPGQKVLLLLPSSTSKILTKWQGPYMVTRKISPVTYEIEHPERKKKKQIYHVNLLKEWKEQVTQPVKATLVVGQPEKEAVNEEVLKETLTLGLEHLTREQITQLSQVFQEVSSLFSNNPGRTTLAEHTIRLKEAKPVRQQPYRVPQQLIGKLHEEVDAMLSSGVIEPSNSEWCSPVVIVTKKDGSLRICIDFRKLNSVSEFDAYPMPRIDDLLEKIGSAAYITTLDMCKGYWQVPLAASSRPYTAFQTPSGLFQFTVMPFGLHGAPATFQRLMNKVLQGCEEFSAAYLDDVVIFSSTWEEHLQHLKRVLGKLKDSGLSLNISKCEWAKQETQYLGYRLGKGEVRPQLDKVEAVRNCPRPKTKKEIRSFLGLAGWYRRFVPDFATIAAPLTALTAKGQKNPLCWTEECERAFNALKACLCSTPVLRSPDFNRRFLVQVDASAVGLGAVLVQGDPGQEHPVLYLSRKLLPRETRYSVVEKEALAIKWALERLRYYLVGREFDLETDHRALTWINSMKDRNSRITRWYLSLQPFRFNVRHRSGKMNLVADYLSRLPYSANLGEEGDDVTK
uniref:Gypsy retrotransposon integrase-like protein 1 n=1 Tax=Oryzias latipes TaxID=8090 RepID=A0A3P9LR23_ORYLA